MSSVALGESAPLSGLPRLGFWAQLLRFPLIQVLKYLITITTIFSCAARVCVLFTKPLWTVYLT